MSRIVRQVPVSGGLPEKIWDQRGLQNPFLWSWSPDGNYLLFHEGVMMGAPTWTSILDRQTMETTRFLADPAHWVFYAHFSGDGRWVTFATTDFRARQRLYVAPFRKALVPMSEWIPVTDGSTWNANPNFSHDSRLLFFTSNRDGFHCIWAQPLTASMHPSGSPFGVYHSHHSRRSLGNGGTNADLSMVARKGMIVFTQVGFTGNVWLLDPAKSGGK
jgi:hypothetical protein